MKQSNGYGGPVAHYWSESLHYIWPAVDWRYQGLIEGFVSLYKKTGQKKFLNEAAKCGDFILSGTKSDGSFLNDHFEDNPSFGRRSLVHDAAVDIGLLKLAFLLREKKYSYKKYLFAAMNNLENVLFPYFFDKEEKTFRQYEIGTYYLKENLFVPNKICTAIELLLILYNKGKKKTYLKLAENAAKKSTCAAGHFRLRWWDFSERYKREDYHILCSKVLFVVKRWIRIWLYLFC